jgi:predicted lipid carrier protein YhbT
MSDATEQFFDELGKRGYEPALATVSGRVRFDIVHRENVQHWLVTINRGAISVARRKGKADCTICAEIELFDRVVRGDDNAMAATLRGALICAGDVDLLLAVQKLIPGRTDQVERAG